jgi:RNA polymerase sigma factor (sigma-70 family)
LIGRLGRDAIVCSVFGSAVAIREIMSDDATLLRRYAETRAEDAFAELVRRHLDGVYSSALRRVGGDVHLAQDVAQQVFIALARKAPSVARHRVVTSWLYTVTRNEAANVVRREQRRKAREHEAQTMQHLLTNTVPPADWSQVGPVLDAVIDELGETERAAILLRFVDGRGFAEIGAALRLSEDAARMRLERALDKLRALLARRGIASTSAALGVALANHAVGAAPAGLAGAVSGAAVAAAAASAATVSASAMNFLGVMSTTKFAGVIAGLAVAVAIGVAFHGVRGSRVAEAARVVAMHEADVLAARLRVLQQRVDESERAVASRRMAVPGAASGPGVSPAPAAEPPSTIRDPTATGREFVAAHPEALPLLADYARRHVTARYHALFLQLGLTATESERFCDLAQQFQAGISWNTASQAPFARFEVGDFSASQIEAQLHELLGDERYRHYREFDRVNGARRLAEEVARSSYYAESPLTSGQAQALVALIVRNGPNYRAGDFMAGRNSGLVNLDWDKVLAEAGTLLAAPQVATLAAIRDRAHFDRAMNQAMAQAMHEARIAAGIPPDF